MHEWPMCASHASMASGIRRSLQGFTHYYENVTAIDRGYNITWVHVRHILCVVYMDTYLVLPAGIHEGTSAMQCCSKMSNNK